MKWYQIQQQIQRILQNHQPPLESEILEYLESFLEGMEEFPDEDERETIHSTLSEFLNPSECESIHSLLLETSHQTTNRSSNGQTTNNNNNTRLARNSSPTKVQSTTTNKNNTNTKEEKQQEHQNEKSQTQPKETRKQRRQTKQKTGGKKETKLEEGSDLVDDHASAWKDRQKEGKLWGGRGHGGRGIRYTGENYDNIHLPSVSLQFEGNELLTDSPMDIVRGHRYALLGRNGVGKSTLFKQLAAHAIPGVPHGMKILLVQQQIEGRMDQTALEALMEADTDRTSLLQEMEIVEMQLEQGIDLETNAQRLSDIVAELDAIDADGAEDRAKKILKGLSFTQTMMNGPTANLSGGWRMRLALAQALFVPYSDLILLDESTNHLDLHGMNWLIQYLTNNEDTKQERTLMVVSHDRSFLDAICTDIIVMEHQRLTYHVGNYSEYQRQMQEKSARQAQILDASERQRNKAMAFVQKQQNNKKSTDPNKQRQAKMIKEKKMDRIGNYREDGKRYKLNSLKKLDESYVRLAQKVQIEKDDPVLKLQFPNPTWPPGVPENSPLIQLEDASFTYNKSNKPLLKNLTLCIARGSKIAMVGNNGSGKTTLIKWITGDLEGQGKMTGNVWRHPSLRIGHVTQYSVEELEEYARMTVVEYAEEKLSTGKASSSVIKEASGNVRQYLGKFGLGGSHAHRPIGKLSGGERMRLCFATVLADEPHILFLDESTNHVDLETLDSLSLALKDYQGAVLMVSHNQAFLSGFCKTLWVLEDGRVDVSHDDTETFDELFSNYRSHLLSSSAASDRRHERRVKTEMAKRATKQVAGAKQNTSLMA